MPHLLQKIYPNLCLFNRVKPPHPKKSIKNIKKTIDKIDDIYIMDSIQSERYRQQSMDLKKTLSINEKEII